MDCDDIMLAIADREQRSRTSAEATQYQHHLDECDECRALATEAADDHNWRWVSRLPEDAFDDLSSLVLPMVDPVMFEIDQELASGGMGRITKAHDRRLGREVAIKEVLEPKLRARFEREAMITARLQHPAIVPIYEAGVWPNGSAFYTMRLVWGGTLAVAIHKTKTMAQRLALLPHVVAVTEALAYAHSNRIIHRDLKPGNVLVGEFGETVVIDWGLAKELDHAIDHTAIGTPRIPATGAGLAALAELEISPSGVHLTRAGAVLGTPGFMAPEQANGEVIDERADVYALGAILYNLLAGEPPYWDKHANAAPELMIELGRSGPPTPIAELAPETPVDLVAIVERAMARRKQDRYPTAKELAEELRRFEAGKLIARQYTLRELAMRWIRKHRTAVAVGAIAMVALAVVVVLAFINIDGSRDAERDARKLAEISQQRSDEQRAIAEANVSALLEEQGRTELLGGDRTRALTNLAAAYAHGRDTPALRYLLAAASRGLDLLLYAFPEDTEAIAFLGGDRTVTIERERIVVRDGPTEVKSHALPIRVRDATFDPTGRVARLLGGASDSTGEYQRWFGVWDVETGAERWRTADPKVIGATRTFSPDGKLMALFEGRKATRPLEVRDAETGTVVRSVPIKGVGAAAFSPDHGLLATCSYDTKRLEVWRTTAPARPAYSIALEDRCTEVAFLDDNRVVIATNDPEVVFWKLGEPRPYRTNAGHSFIISGLAINTSAELVATGDYNGIVRLWSFAGEPLGEVRDIQGSIERLEFARDGSALVGTASENRVFVWDTAPLDLRHAIEGRNARPDFAIDPSGKRLATLTDGHVRVWTFPVGGRLARVSANTAAIARDRWITAENDKLVVRRLDTTAQLLTIDHDTGKNAAGETYFWWAGELRAAASGTFAAYTSFSGGTESFDPTRENPAVAYDTPRTTYSTTSDDGRYLLVPDAKHVRVLLGGKLVRQIDADDDVYEGSISPDGDRLVVAMSGKVQQWRVSTGEPLAPAMLPADVRYPYTPRFDPTGKTYALYSGDEPVLLIDAATGARLAAFPTRTKAEGVAFSRDGKRLAIAGTSTVEVWDADGKHRFSVTSTNKNAYALGDDGELVATGSADGSIRLWDASGRLLDRFAGHSKQIEKLELAAGRLLAVGNDGYATLWDVHLDRRSSAEVSTFADRHSSWKLVGVQLVQK